MVSLAIKLILLRWVRKPLTTLHWEANKIQESFFPDATAVKCDAVLVYQNSTAYSLGICCIRFRSIQLVCVIDKCFSVEQVLNTQFLFIFFLFSVAVFHLVNTLKVQVYILLKLFESSNRFYCSRYKCHWFFKNKMREKWSDKIGL